MMPTIKAEFRKLLTVRSTWFIMFFAFAIAVLLIGFWIFGYKDVENAATNSRALQSGLYQAMAFVGVIFSFMAVLLVGHEYRYNTVMYSLTAANHRTKVYLAKLIAVSVVSLVGASIIAALFVVAMYVGLHFADIVAIGQRMPAFVIGWRLVAIILGNIAFAFFITFLLRSLIGAMAVVLLLPSTIEGLLSLLLKEKTQYLPYSALNGLLSTNPDANTNNLLIAVAGYILLFGSLSYILFLKRDAN